MQQTIAGECRDALHKEPLNKLNASAPPCVGSTCYGDNVALPTALGNMNGKREGKVRDLFDSGPECFKKGEREWPSNLMVGESKEVEKERRKACVFSVVTEKKVRGSNTINIDQRFSSLGRLLNMMAWLMRFIFKLKQKRVGKEMKKEELQVEEVIEAGKLWM